jgi:hypothetical protein
VIEARRRQGCFADGFLHEAVDEFWDDWMRAVDRLLDDDALVATVYEALGRRRPQSRTRGRLGPLAAPARVARPPHPGPRMGPLPYIPRQSRFSKV